MTSSSPPIDVRGKASAVMAVLADLQGYLSSSLNPDRIALADLEMELMGWTKKVYSQKAFDIWRRQLDTFPDDPLILHHMAIMHHARAFDLEAGPRPAESDADWIAAMKHWHRLHQMDAFWDNLTVKACAGSARQDVIKKLRADFPQMLLAVHFDIALDKETRDKRKTRAKFHVGMVHNAPFDAHVRAESQRAAYNRFIASVAHEVWQPDELREEVLAAGQKTIVEFLDFDPGCTPALEDALRLQRRVQRSRNNAWRAMNDADPNRKQLLALEKKDAERWGPFFDQLLAVADKLDDDVREDLSRWYHGRGHDLRVLDLEEQATAFFERAVSACRADDDGRKACVRDLVQCLARRAHEKVANDAQDARSFCDKLARRDDLTGAACLVLAHAYLGLSLFDVATEICDRGLHIEPDFDDLEADEGLRRLKDLKQEIPLTKRIRTASADMQAGRHQEALQALNDAATASPRNDLVFFLRAQANLATGNIADARRDAEIVTRLAENDRDREHARQLSERVGQAEVASAIKPLLEKARNAMEAGQYADALLPLNEAAVKAPRVDMIFFLRAQAHLAMGNIADAGQDAKTVADLAETDDDRQHAQRLSEMVVQAQGAIAVKSLLAKARQVMEAGRFADALTPLNEAARKSPRADIVFFMRAQAHLGAGNIAEARKDAKTVADLAETDEDRQHARRLSEMIEKQQADSAIKGLLDQAGSAIKRGSFSDATRLLDKAVEIAPQTSVIYFLRAQARMGASDVAGARADAMEFERLADSAEERQAATRLKNALFG